MASVRFYLQPFLKSQLDFLNKHSRTDGLLRRNNSQKNSHQGHRCSAMFRGTIIFMYMQVVSTEADLKSANFE